MKRRDFLATAGGTAMALSLLPFQHAVAANKKMKKQRLLYFTRSAGYEHGVVKRQNGQLAFAEKTMIDMGKQAGFDVDCTKDGRVFDGDLDRYDAIAFYTTGDLTQPNKQHTPPMTATGKQRLLDAIAAGKGFVGFHSATDTFHSPAPRAGSPNVVDPYIAMIGGEFLSHGAQQKSTLTVTAAGFPGLRGLGQSVRFFEEWYTLKNLANDLHVILLQQTKGMRGGAYQRPPYPATWARKHGKGRVYYTSFGHREDIWTNPRVQQIMLGGIAWAMGNVDANVAPNVQQVAPGANQLHQEN